FSSSCSAGSISLSTGGSGGHTLADLVQAWADGPANDGMILRAASETDTTGWKKFKSSESGSLTTPGPNLTVVYNTLPAVPDVLSADLGQDPPVLHGRYTDAEGGTGHVAYAVYDSEDTLIASGNGSTESTGTDSPLTL